MYSISSKTRAAATGAAGVMVLGGLAAFGPISTADAATTAPTNYVCTVLGNPIPASVVGQARLPKRIKQGRSLAGIPVTMKITIPDAAIHNIASTLQLTQLGGKVTQGALRLTKPGTVKTVPLRALSIPTTSVPATGNMSLTASGKTARKAKAPVRTGRYLIKMPKSFTFKPTSDSQVIQIPSLPCSLKGKPGNFGHLRVIHR